ncbi:hypothetical protein GCM10027598_77050 [Amycolatopsis oliviviridis]|uniref:Uncharacterized protein n=1 Tax=Amycolatopsis oliviviridis TaxID=1471590 RepID=A0ABQ3LAP0_9PSEU|nr:hypothetical protein GCM10017790_06990 [Amycolatopsis oliviviridis]
MVGVEQPGGGLAVHGRGEFPAEVHGVTEAEVEALGAERRVHVGGVAGEEHPALAVGPGLACVVRPAGRPPPQARDRHRDAGDVADRALQFFDGHGRVLVLGLRREPGDENASRHRSVGVDPARRPVPPAAQFARVVEIRDGLITHQFRVGAHEVDAEPLADDAPPAVGRDDPPGGEVARAGLDHHIGIVVEAGAGATQVPDLDTAPDPDTQPGAVLAEQQFEVVLRHQDPVRHRRVRGQDRIGLVDQVVPEHEPREMPEDRKPAGGPARRRGQVAHRPVRAAVGERGRLRQTTALHLLRGGQQTTPVQDFGAGDVDRAGFDRRIRLRQPLQHGHPHSSQRQLARGEQAGGSRSDHDHIGSLHDHSKPYSVSLLGKLNE